ncbi:MAG: S24 family peptidase [Anaerolineales bacterium]|nr:MAG: hypothetical protein EDM79_12455 [Chloroflexota bacterium]MCK6567688.1 S24 family peptidase [Anaerolineales bacterium]
MTPIPKTLTGLLDIEDATMERVRVSIIASFDNVKDLRRILTRQCANRDETNCYRCEQEGVCFFMNGVLQFKLGANGEAVKTLEAASRYFRGQGDVWNGIVGRAMLASVHEANGEAHKALREYRKAYDTVTNDHLRLHSTEYDEKALILQNLLHDQIKDCDRQGAKAQPSPRARPKAARPATRLTMPWMRAYSGVYANPNGPTQSEYAQRSIGVHIDEIILDGKPHRIFSLRRGDNLLSLIQGEKYAWAKISGDSMSAAKPVAINQNDFVLYYEAGGADEGGIVVASCPDALGAGHQFVVKRFSKANRLLISETDPPGLYEPMPINKSIRIIGIVIAVAKPGDGAEGEIPKTGPHTPQGGASRYIELIQLVQGDSAVADRLIDHEQVLSPQSSREECIEKAISRLLHDRRA